MEALAAIQAAMGLVSTFGPMIPEVVNAVPTIEADAKKIAADVQSLNATSTISDLEGLLSAIPTGIITTVINESKTLKI